MTWLIGLSGEGSLIIRVGGEYGMTKEGFLLPIG